MLADPIQALELFNKCINISENGRNIECKLGLWGTYSRSPKAAIVEAMSYWQQYYRDGEYSKLLDSLIAPPSASDRPA